MNLHIRSKKSTQFDFSSVVKVCMTSESASRMHNHLKRSVQQKKIALNPLFMLYTHIFSIFSMSLYKNKVINSYLQSQHSGTLQCISWWVCCYWREYRFSTYLWKLLYSLHAQMILDQTSRMDEAQVLSQFWIFILLQAM